MSAVVGVALMSVAAAGLSLSEPGEDNFQVRTAPLGEAVPYNDGLLKVDDVRVGTALTRTQGYDGDTPVSTTGVFVVARVTVRAPDRDDVTVSEARLLAQGVTYTTSTSLSSVTARPGFESSTDFTFEVDPAQMQDLTIELWTAGPVVGYHQRVRSFLGVTPANAAQWAASAQGRTVTVDTTRTTRAIA